MKYTRIGISLEYHQKLKVLAEHNKRSMMKQLEYMIDKEYS